MDWNIKRAYKEESPLKTVTKIREILAEVDCITYEVSWRSPYREIHSNRIETDEKDGLFGTNGKGRTRIYTLASGYAEFIERLQNSMISTRSFARFFLNKIKDETGYHFFPDEKVFSKDDFKNLPIDFLRDFFLESKSQIIDILFQRLRIMGTKG